MKVRGFCGRLEQRRSGRLKTKEGQREGRGKG
jgi:hypothetical protein